MRLTQVPQPIHPAQRAALLAIVLLAAALRFSGLDWGLRHPIHTDERVYVDNVVKMVAAGDLNHRFYTYPALFFYTLAPGVALLGPERWHTPEVFLVSRWVVSAFGVFNVALACFVGTRLLGPVAGLVAALLMAVSPVDVHTSHQVRPDVILETFGLLLLLALRGIGPRLRDDAMAGLLIGLAASMKFTGLLMVPTYIARRLVEPGPRVRGLFVAGAVTIAVAILCTPYAVLRAEEYWHGPPRQLGQYYPGSSALTFPQKIVYFLEAATDALGPLAALLVPIGAVLALRRAPRFYGPFLLHPPLVVLVMATGALVFQRYILQAMGLVFLLAALPVARLAERQRWAALVLAVGAAALPLRVSSDYVRRVSQPSAQDKAVDWIAAHAPRHARILETRHDADPGGRAGAMLGLDPLRYEVLHVSPGEDRPGLRLLVPEMDYVITGPGAGGQWGASLRTLFEARGPAGDLVLQIKTPEAGARPAYEPLDLSRVRVSVSDDVEHAAALVDGDPKTAWSTPGPMMGGEWIRVDWEEPVDVGVVELFVRTRPSRYDPELRVLTSADGRTYEETRFIDARAPLIDQAAAGRRLSQQMILAPRPVRGVRVVQLGRRDAPWSLTELRVAVRRPSN